MHINIKWLGNAALWGRVGRGGGCNKKGTGVDDTVRLEFYLLFCNGNEDVR